MSSTKFPVTVSSNSGNSKVNLFEEDLGNPQKKSADESSPVDGDGDPLLRFYQSRAPPNVRVFKRDHPERLPNETDEEYQFRWEFYEYAKLHPLTSPSYFYDVEPLDLKEEETLLSPVKQLSSSSSSSSFIPYETNNYSKDDDKDIVPPALSVGQPEFVDDIINSAPNLYKTQTKENHDDFQNVPVSYYYSAKDGQANSTTAEVPLDLPIEDEESTLPSALKKRPPRKKSEIGMRDKIKRTKFKLSSPPSQQSSMSCLPTTFSTVSTSYSSYKLANKRPLTSRPKSRSRSPTSNNKRYKKSFEEMFHRPTSVPSQTWYENVALRRELTSRYTFVSPSTTRKMSAPHPLHTSKSHQQLITDRLHCGKPTSAKSDKRMVSTTISRTSRFS